MVQYVPTVDRAFTALADADVVVGKSASHAPLVENWQITTWQRKDVLLGPLREIAAAHVAYELLSVMAKEA